jgi:hypothetical protein
LQYWAMHQTTKMAKWSHTTGAISQEMKFKMQGEHEVTKFSRNQKVGGL